jgi:CRP-like cAMP-binding protein
MIRRVEYFESVPDDILYEIIFSLETKIFDKE